MIDLTKRILTIDDTHEGNLILAEMLVRHGLQNRTIFFASFNDDNNPSDIVRHLSSRGFTIGSHTLNHPHLTKIPLAEATKEIKESKQYIEFLTGMPCNYFSYPFGSFNKEVTQEVKNAGYVMARTTEEKDDDFNKGSFQLDGLKGRFDRAIGTTLGFYHLHAISIENYNSYSDFNDFLKWI